MNHLIQKKDKVSMSVIRRLPRYFRFLSELEKNNIFRISSRELADRMSITASQIRQDLNCFGGFGQQGYGYMVGPLKEEIRNIMGLNRRYPCILIGAGNLGKAVAAHMNFEQRGFSLIGIFDRSADLIGKTICGFLVRDINDLDIFCQKHKPTMAILCLPQESAEQVSEQLIQNNISCFWNFSHYDITAKHPEVTMECVHMSDSLMTLCYRIQEKENDASIATEKST